MTPHRLACGLVLAAVLAVASCSDDTVERLASATTAPTTSIGAGVSGTGSGGTGSGGTGSGGSGSGGPSGGPAATAAPTTAPNGGTPNTTRPTGSTTTAAPAAPATSPVTTSRAAALFGVPIGAAADGAVATLAGLLGPPTNDSGWGIGCPLDHPTDKNERVVVWGRLRVQFRRATETAAGAMEGYGFTVPQGTSLAATDAAARLALPSGVKLGMPIAEVATALASKTETNAGFGTVSVTTPGAVFSADGSTGTAPLNAVSVPHVFACD